MGRAGDKSPSQREEQAFLIHSFARRHFLSASPVCAGTQATLSGERSLLVPALTGPHSADRNSEAQEV